MQHKHTASSRGAKYFICQNCHFVDSDFGRVKVPSPCSKCKQAFGRATMHFGLTVVGIINMMDEFYKAKIPPMNLGRASYSYLGVVVMFVTLREILLSKFIEDMLEASNLTQGLKSKLLRDHPTHYLRLNELFPALCGKTWRKTIEDISSPTSHNYAALDKFMVRIVKTRNGLLHNGDKWTPKPKDADECFLNLSVLLKLHVDLHNHCVYPLHNVK